MSRTITFVFKDIHGIIIFNLEKWKHLEIYRNAIRCWNQSGYILNVKNTSLCSAFPSSCMGKNDDNLAWLIALHNSK